MSIKPMQLAGAAHLSKFSEWPASSDRSPPLAWCRSRPQLIGMSVMSFASIAVKCSATAGSAYRCSHP